VEDEAKPGGRFVVLVNGGDDPKVQYLTAKELVKVGVRGPFQEILDKMRKGENVVLQRVETPTEAQQLLERFIALGARAWLAKQKKISGHDVF
jgi:hypothetical protein